MRIIDLAVKDLTQIVRDWRTVAFLLLMPIAFTLLFGFVFSGGDGDDDPRLPVGFLDEDGGEALSRHLFSLLAASDAVRPVRLDDAKPDDVMDQVRDEELAAAIVVPAGFTGQTLILATEDAPVPALIVSPDSTAGATANSAIEAVVARLVGSVQAAKLVAAEAESQGETADQAYLEQVVATAVAAWEDPPLGVTSTHTGGAAATDGDGGETDPYGSNNYAHSSAGIMVQFAMAGLMGAAEIIMLEKKNKTLQRLLTTAIRRWEIILGHFLAMFVLVLAQLLILVLFGQLVLGVEYFGAPAATLFMVLTTALWAASLGLLIGVVAKTEEQVIIMALMLMLILSGLGGAWMPLEFTSEAFQTVGHLTPTAWAIDGFENIVVRGLGLDSVLVPGAILLGFAAVLFGVAVWRFRYE